MISRLGPLRDYLNMIGQDVIITPEADLWLDSQRLNTALDEHLQAPNTLTPQKAENLRQQLALYQGDFLAGFHLRDALAFEEWTIFERERLQHRVVQCLDDLITYYMDQDLLVPGIDLARRLLTLDPLREQTHRQLMIMLAANGQRNAALTQFELCVQVLADELDLEPSLETQDLAQEIRRQIEFASPPITTPSTFLHHNLTSSLTPFFGRQRDIERIQARLQDPNCRCITIHGPGGVGKTRLAQETIFIGLDEATDLQAFEHGIYFCCPGLYQCRFLHDSGHRQRLKFFLLWP